MVEESSAGAAGHPVLEPRIERAFAALLAIDAAEAERVRDRSPGRRRPRPQRGPLLDLGGDPAQDDDDDGDGSTVSGSDRR